MSGQLRRPATGPTSHNELIMRSFGRKLPHTLGLSSAHPHALQPSASGSRTRHMLRASGHPSGWNRTAFCSLGSCPRRRGSWRKRTSSLNRGTLRPCPGSLRSPPSGTPVTVMSGMVSAPLRPNRTSRNRLTRLLVGEPPLRPCSPRPHVMPAVVAALLRDAAPILSITRVLHPTPRRCHQAAVASLPSLLPAPPEFPHPTVVITLTLIAPAGACVAAPALRATHYGPSASPARPWPSRLSAPFATLTSAACARRPPPA